MPTVPAAPNFDVIAPVYDALASLVFGESQQHAQAHFLSRVPAQARVLVVGGGTGLILEKLLQKASPAHVLYLESSARMLQKARQRLYGHPAGNTIEFRNGTEKALRPQENFHVILTPFVLDIFPAPALQDVVDTLSASLLPAGKWLHTDFHLSARRYVRLWQKPLLWGMYHFFRLVSGVTARQLPDFNVHFQAAGLVQTEEAFFFGEFIKASVLLKAGPSQVAER